MRILPALILGLPLLLHTGCTPPAATPSAPAPAAKGSLDQLVGFMCGSFSSEEQAKADPINFFDIRLEAVRIWPTRTDGSWLYVEQATADNLAVPYRQRIYQVEALPDGRFRSTVYVFKRGALDHAGAWKSPAPLAEVGMDQIETRPGCAVTLAFDGKGTYAGATNDRECASILKGASYATSEVTITATEVRSWDRGWDGDGKQVWGAQTGGYRFRRVAPR